MTETASIDGSIEPGQRPVVVVLTFQPPDGVLKRCIESVLQSGDAEHVVVVDNGHTLTHLDLTDDRVTLVTPPDNLGYAGGMNAGLRHAASLGASTVALLNDDTVVEAGWLATLHRALRTTRESGARVGAVQPKLLLSDTSPAQLNSVGVRWRADGAGIDIGYGEVDRGQYDGERPIDIFTGGAVLVAADFIEDLGGFDERYFMYYEDIDLALRGRDRGWTYLVVPAAVVHHAVGGTSKTMPAKRRYWQERNRLWCLFRHGSPANIGRGLVLSALRLGKHPTRAQASAIVDGLRAAPRLYRERRAARSISAR